MAHRNTLDGLPARAKARLRQRAQPAWAAPMLATLTDERFFASRFVVRKNWLNACRGGPIPHMYSQEETERALGTSYTKACLVQMWWD